MASINQITRAEFVRVIIEDRYDQAWEYCHFIREWVATLERGEKGSSWEDALLDGIAAISKRDSNALDKVIRELTTLTSK